MKKLLKYLIVFVAVPIVILLGVFVFDDSRYMWIALCTAVLACVPFFTAFEKKNTGTVKLVLVAVMTALTVLGRAVFSFIPFFKPITAIVIICGMYLGAEAGFLCGALSAFISNFIFMQGPWTAFQMFAWGIIGFAAALLSGALKESKLCLYVFGAVGGFLYSLILDVNTVLWMDNTFSIARYITALGGSVWFTVIYAVSNVVFLVALAGPIGKKLQRVTVKYGI